MNQPKLLTKLNDIKSPTISHSYEQNSLIRQRAFNKQWDALTKEEQQEFATIKNNIINETNIQTTLKPADNILESLRDKIEEALKIYPDDEILKENLVEEVKETNFVEEIKIDKTLDDLEMVNVAFDGYIQKLQSGQNIAPVITGLLEAKNYYISRIIKKSQVQVAQEKALKIMDQQVQIIKSEAEQAKSQTQKYKQEVDMIKRKYDEAEEYCKRLNSSNELTNYQYFQQKIDNEKLMSQIRNVLWAKEQAEQKQDELKTRMTRMANLLDQAKQKLKGQLLEIEGLKNQLDSVYKEKNQIFMSLNTKEQVIHELQQDKRMMASQIDMLISQNTQSQERITTLEMKKITDNSDAERIQKAMGQLIKLSTAEYSNELAKTLQIDKTEVQNLQLIMTKISAAKNIDQLQQIMDPKKKLMLTNAAVQTRQTSFVQKVVKPLKMQSFVRNEQVDQVNKVQEHVLQKQLPSIVFDSTEISEYEQENEQLVTLETGEIQYQSSINAYEKLFGAENNRVDIRIFQYLENFNPNMSKLIEQGKAMTLILQRLEPDLQLQFKQKFCQNVTNTVFMQSRNMMKIIKEVLKARVTKADLIVRLDHFFSEVQANVMNNQQVIALLNGYLFEQQLNNLQLPNIYLNFVRRSQIQTVDIKQNSKILSPMQIDEEKSTLLTSTNMQVPVVLGGINEGSLATIFAKNNAAKSQADTPILQSFKMNSAKNFMIKSQKQQLFSGFKVINEDSKSENMQQYSKIDQQFKHETDQKQQIHQLRQSETSETRQQEYKKAQILSSESEEIQKNESSESIDIINQFYEESNLISMAQTEAALSEKLKTNNSSNNVLIVGKPSIVNNVSQSNALVLNQNSQLLMSAHTSVKENTQNLQNVLEKQTSTLLKSNTQQTKQYIAETIDQETQTSNQKSFSYSEKVENKTETDIFSLTKPEISFATVIYQELQNDPEKVVQLIDNIKEELEKEKFYKDYQTNSEEKKFNSQYVQTENVGIDKAIQLEQALFEQKRNQIVENLANVFKISKNTDNFDPTEEIAEFERDQDSKQNVQFNIANKQLEQYAKNKLSYQEAYDQNMIQQQSLKESIQVQNQIIQKELKDKKEQDIVSYPQSDISLKKIEPKQKKIDTKTQSIQKYHQQKGQKVLKGFYMSSKYFNFENNEQKTVISNQQTKLEAQFIDPINIKNIVCEIKQSYIEHHPHYGQYFEIKNDLDEAPELIKFAALHQKDKIYMKYLPDHNQNNLTCPCIVKAYDFQELKELQQNTYNTFEAEFCNTTNIQVGATLFPSANQRILLVRLSSLGSKEPMLFRYLFKQFKFQPRFQQFAGQKYIEMPFTNISFRSITFIKQLVREIINARTTATCSFLLQEVTKSEVTQTMQTRYKQISGSISRGEFESVASFTLSYLTQKYGQQSLVLQVLFNLISNLAFYQYEDAELYLFCRFLFDDLENDYQQLYFEMRRILNLQSYNIENVELVSAEIMGPLIQEVFQGFDTNRQQQFMNQLSQVIYARTVEKVTPKILLFSELASLFLFQYGVYRRQVWGQFSIVYNFLLQHKIGDQQFSLSKSKLLSNSSSLDTKENLSLAKFSVLCEILIPQWTISTVQEVFFAFQSKNISVQNLEELFKSHQLARFVKIDKQLIKSATTTENVERTMSLLELFKILNPVAEKMKLMFQVKGKQEVSMQISNLIEVIKSDLSIFDTQKAIQNIFAIIEVFCKNMIKKREDVVMAIVTGAVTSMTLFG